MKRLLIPAVFFVLIFRLHAQQIPDIELHCLNNDTIQLTDFHGKILLIEFWASWNRQSRENHKQLVSLYNRYKYSGFQHSATFDMISISIDLNEKDWQSAIEQDALHWRNHCCDFKGWKTEAVIKFDVYLIPFYLLIDDEGKIVKRQAHLNEIERYLQEMTVK
ncbi:MAG TPA: TlpA disulfide reductase family protein [Bacteroidia bacterium]|nr:TlpA disulfide reductase family protein [Bacteroidia bacterium]HRS58585.1 TlpA disulfide reductase family protein [Bacteroidia bacterium]HRU68048.1 TlpA disulfide reductase family protein [Bacteroidia bacterium]